MKTNKLLLTGAIIFWLTLQSVGAAYTEVECSSDPVFAQNTCNQCFNGWEKGQGEAFGFINDIFINKTTNPKLLYKEEQSMPSMINLGWDKVTWSQTPSADNFWQYTKDFETIFSSGQEAYVIAPSGQVSWIESKTWYAYKLDKNTVARWQNIGLLLFSVMSHDIINNEVAIDQIEHRECVLFKSWVPSNTPAPIVVENAPVKKLPQTGPEHILLVLIALLLGLGLFGLKRKTN
jgi:LPXTG-motif cell wall-anchored protein